MDFFTPEKDRQQPENADAESGLPSVLIIGDSISQGYTPLVRDLLEGRWNVQRPRANCGNTFFGLEKLDEWLGDTDWDVIHFNWGLHDLCYRHPESTEYGNRDKIRGTQTMSPGMYAQNLEELVERLKPSSRFLVWANTTYIPSGEAGRYQGDDVRYNAFAADVMVAHGIPTNDLYSLTASFGPELFWKPCDVHFSEAGYDIIAKQVAALIDTFGSAG